MNKFCVLSFSLLLCLAGCKDSENKKELMNIAKSYNITTLETFGMTLDLTTKDQAINVLKSNGYVWKDVTKENRSILSDILSQLTQFSQDPTKILTPFPEEAVRDKLAKFSIIFAADSKIFQEENDKLKEIIDSKKEYMVFIFDENKKLIIFFKQYSENKEKVLRIYELTGGSDIASNSKNYIMSFFRKDLSKAFIGTKNSKATTYGVFSSSISKDHVSEFRKAMKIAEKLKETQEVLKIEKENFKGIEEEYLNGLINLKEFREKLREKRKELNKSKEYIELKKKINTKVYKELKLK